MHGDRRTVWGSDLSDVAILQDASRKLWVAPLSSRADRADGNVTVTAAAVVVITHESESLEEPYTMDA